MISDIEVLATGASGPDSGDCGSTDFFSVVVEAEDDRTQAGLMGYLVIPRGETPGAFGAEHFVRPPGDRRLHFARVSDGSDVVDAEYDVYAVDLAGNLSEPSRLEIVGEAEGCSQSGRSGGAGWVLVVGALFIGLSIRKRR